MSSVRFVSPLSKAETEVPDGPPQQAPTRRKYQAAIEWAFGLFNATRFLTYLPTIMAIRASGESSQHSILTWLAWIGANATMALWLFENNGRRLDKAIVVSIGNALMCSATCAMILFYRR